MNKTNSKLALIGNITIDKILRVEDFKLDFSNLLLETNTRLGGLINVARPIYDKMDITIHSTVGPRVEAQLNKLSGSLQLDLNTNSQDTDAFIILEENRRTSIVNWQKVVGPYNIHPKTDWVHICYLDTTDITATEIRNFPGIVSADLCLQKEPDWRMIECLSEIDFLITSKDCYNHVILCNIKNCVIHDSSGSYSRIKGKEDFVKCSQKSNVNVLGAGDVFAGYFIYNYLHESYPIEKTHRMTGEFLDAQTKTPNTYSW